MTRRDAAFYAIRTALDGYLVPAATIERAALPVYRITGRMMQRRRTDDATQRRLHRLNRRAEAPLKRRRRERETREATGRMS